MPHVRRRSREHPHAGRSVFAPGRQHPFRRNPDVCEVAEAAQREDCGPRPALVAGKHLSPADRQAPPMDARRTRPMIAPRQAAGRMGASIHTRLGVGVRRWNYMAEVNRRKRAIELLEASMTRTPPMPGGGSGSGSSGGTKAARSRPGSQPHASTPGAAGEPPPRARRADKMHACQMRSAHARIPLMSVFGCAQRDRAARCRAAPGAIVQKAAPVALAQRARVPRPRETAAQTRPRGGGQCISRLARWAGSPQRGAGKSGGSSTSRSIWSGEGSSTSPRLPGWEGMFTRPRWPTRWWC